MFNGISVAGCMLVILMVSEMKIETQISIHLLNENCRQINVIRSIKRCLILFKGIKYVMMCSLLSLSLGELTDYGCKHGSEETYGHYSKLVSETLISSAGT